MISQFDQAQLAHQRGWSIVEFCIDSISGSSPWIKPTDINVVSRHLDSIEKVMKFVASVPNASVRIIDTNIVTKYIIHDVCIDMTIADKKNNNKKKN